MALRLPADVPSDMPANDPAPPSNRLRRRGLIAGAAALAASALVSQQAHAAVQGTAIYYINYGSTGPFDARADAIQGYAGMAHTAGVFGRNDSQDGEGVTGEATNSVGVYGQSTQGTGVQGTSTNRRGVYGISANYTAVQGDSTTSTGVLGNSVNANGVTGHSNLGYGVYGSTLASAVPQALGGVLGDASSSGSHGVVGRASSGLVAGVYGSNNSSYINSYGVYGTGIYGVYGNSTQSAGAGVYGTAPSIGVQGATSATSSYGVYGTATGMSSFGVFGNSTQSAGTVGYSPAVFGVWGQTDTGGSALYGTSTAGFGAYGTSANSYGVYGVSAQSHGTVGQTSGSGYAGLYGYAVGTGSFAGSFSGRVTITNGQADNGLTCTSTPGGFHSIFSYTKTTGGAAAIYASGNAYGIGAPQGTNYAGIFDGDVTVGGRLVAVGSIKSAAVPHPDGSHRLLYCMEAPEAWFEDFGEGTLAGGKADVKLDPDFAAVVDTTQLHVFLTPHDAAHHLAVTAQSGGSFAVEADVSGTAAARGVKPGDVSGTFTYRVVAKRKDVPSPRLAKFTVPKQITIPDAPPASLTQAPQALTNVPMKLTDADLMPRPVPPAPRVPAEPIVTGGTGEPSMPSATATPNMPVPQAKT